MTTFATHYAKGPGDMLPTQTAALGLVVMALLTWAGTIGLIYFTIFTALEVTATYCKVMGQC